MPDRFIKPSSFLKPFRLLRHRLKVLVNAFRYPCRPHAVCDYSICLPERADLLRYFLLSTGMCFLIAYTFYKSSAAFFLLLAADWIFYPSVLKKKLIEKRMVRLNTQFGEVLGILNGFLGAGYSVENAFAGALKEALPLFGSESDLCIELEVLLRGIRSNIPVEKLLSDLAQRSGQPDILCFAQVFGIAKRTGGDLRVIIDQTTGILREKAQVRRDILAMTASRRYEQKIMNFIPFALILYINLTSPGQLDILYEGPAGRLIMTLCLSVLLFSCFLQNSLLNIEV